MKLPLTFPLKPFVITQHFGQNLAAVYKDVWHLLGHPGIDMVGSYGQVVRAACEGQVTYVGTDSNQGAGIVIITNGQYDYKDGVSNFKHIYWHLLDGSSRVKVGDQVQTGDVLAQCNSTGILLGVKNGPVEKSHLHFGTKPVVQGERPWAWDNSEQGNGYNGCIDPEFYFTGDYAADVANLKEQISLAQKIVDLLKKLLGL